MGSKLLKSLMSVVLVIGLMPTLALADDTANGEGGADASDFAQQKTAAEIAVQADSEAEDTRPELVKGENDVFKEYIRDSEIVATLTTDGTLTITGSGEMPGWQNGGTDTEKAQANFVSNRPWLEKNTSGTTIRKIVIGSGITKVGDLSFWGACGNVSEIDLPDTLTEIGYAGFSQQNPETVVVPDGVKLNRGWSFGPRVKKIVYLGACDIASANENVLYNWNNESTPYTAVVAKSNAAVISALASDKTCGNIEEYELLGSCSGEEGYASAVYYTYKDGTLTISGSGAMRDYSDAEKAPWAGEEVENVVVEDGVTHIGENAFDQNANLKSVSISKSVTSLADTAFNAESCKAAGTLFVVAEKSAAEEWLKSHGIIADPTLDEYGRTRLSVDESAGELYKEYIDTPAVKSTTIATFSNDGTLTISGDGDMPGYQNTELDYRPWQKYQDKVKRIVIKNGVTSVGKLSFYLCAANVEEILIPDSVTSIGHAAFSWQQKLTSVAIPANVKSLSSWAFASSLKDVYYLGADNMRSNNVNLLYNYQQSPSYTAHVLEGGLTTSNISHDVTAGAVKTYGEGEMGACGAEPYSSSVYYAYDSATKTLSIMGTQAMRDYTEENPAPWHDLDVQNVVIAESVQHIGAHAFCGNAGIKCVSVAGSATTVGEHAFDPESIDGTYFLCDADSAMASWLNANANGKQPAQSSGACGEHATWKIQGNTLIISGSGAMANYTAESAAPWTPFAVSIASVAIESGIESLGDYAFANLSAVSSVSTRATVSKIGSKAFAGCSSLSSISLPENVTEVSGDSFENCADALNVSGYETTEAAFVGKLSQGKTTIKVTVPNRLKVLFVGNSFSQNAVSQLDQIAKSAGVTETLIANLHQSAHPVSGYVENITSKNNEYIYTERGTLADTSHNSNACNLDYGLTAQDWDIVVIQPYCWQSYGEENGPNGEQFVSANGYEPIATLADYAKKTSTNPKVKLAFYQIWSRPFDYLQFNGAGDHVWKGQYRDGLSSQFVWQQIVNAYDYAEGTSPFSYYVPVGTAIENARLTFLEETPMKDASTSYKNAVGSGLNSDNIHLNAWGSFIDGMTFVKELTGLSIDNVSYKPSGMADSELAMAKIAVNAAFDGPSKNSQGNVDALTYAKVNDDPYATLFDATKAAKFGDTLEIFGMPKSDGELAIPAGVTVKTYGSTQNHEIALVNGGTITDAGLIANAGATEAGTTYDTAVLIAPVTGSSSEQAVAEMGDKKFATVQAAIEAAGDEVATVTLLCSTVESVTIPSEKSIKLDLNGCTLVNSAVAQNMDDSQKADRHSTITNNGTLWIADSSEGDGVLDNVSHGVAALYNNGTAYVQSGAITRSVDVAQSASSLGDGGNSWYVVYNAKDADLNITGGVVMGISKYSSCVCNVGNMTMGGGAIKQQDFIALKNEGTLSFTGGTVTSDEQSLQNWGNAMVSGGKLDGQVTVLAWEKSAENEGTLAVRGNAEIDGGLVVVNYGGEAPKAPSATITENAVVNGGLFTKSGDSIGANNNQAVSGKDKARIDVSGGTFDRVVSADHAADGYAPVTTPNSEGKYEVATAYTLQLLDTDGAVLDELSAAAGEKVTLPGHDVFNHRTFVAWNTAADGTGTPYAEGDQFIMPENGAVLYATWTFDKGWGDVSKFTKDSAPSAEALGYSTDEAKNLAFAGWYESNADNALPCTSNSGIAYAKFVSISDIIKFKGGSLCMDLTEGYDKTSLRFGYEITIPVNTALNNWHFEWQKPGSNWVPVSADNYWLLGNNSAITNLVLSPIGKGSYSVELSSRFFLSYKTKDGTNVDVLENKVNTRSVEDIAESILTDGLAREADKTYATGVLEAMK